MRESSTTSIKLVLKPKQVPWDSELHLKTRATNYYLGCFVAVRIPAEESVESLLIPEAALIRNDQGSFVLTVNSANEVVQKKVTVGQTVSGWAIIQTGLSDNDQVIINGLQRARAGAKVVPTSKTLSVDAEALLRGRGQPNTEARATATPASGNTPPQPATSETTP